MGTTTMDERRDGARAGGQGPLVGELVRRARAGALSGVPGDLISLEEAREVLGVASRSTVTEMLRDGRLRWWPNPFMAQAKYVSRAEVEALARARRGAEGAA